VEWSTRKVLFWKVPALPTKILLGNKGLPGINTLAYYENLQITDIKSFLTISSGIE
jgi:hypothetical protein